MGIILQAGLKMIGRVRPTLYDAATGKIKWQGKWQNNIIPDVGLAAIVRRLGDIGTYSNEGIITYGAVGDGSSTPDANDTQMNNEIERKTIGTASVSGQTLTLEVFFTTAEANGDITQFALFGEEASAASDSGTMFDYINFETPFEKTSSETLTIEIMITAEYGG